MSRDIPPLSWLAAFRTTAACGSVSVAAEQLNLTQSAVSRQVKGLEEFLGLALFTRAKNRLHLTDRGLSYLGEIDPILEGLAAATRSANGSRRNASTLNIATLATFGERWLVPRMGSFLAVHPEVNVNLTIRSNLIDFAFDHLDGAIYFGSETWPGTVNLHLFREQVIAVAAPDLAQTLTSVEHVKRAQLIQVTSRPFSWREWFLKAGAPTMTRKPQIQVETFSMAISAAKAGFCAAVLPVLLIEKELAAGALRPLMEIVYESSGAYHFVYPAAKRNWPAVKRFSVWLSSNLDQAHPDS